MISIPMCLANALTLEDIARYGALRMQLVPVHDNHVHRASRRRMPACASSSRRVSVTLGPPGGEYSICRLASAGGHAPCRSGRQMSSHTLPLIQYDVGSAGTWPHVAVAESANNNARIVRWRASVASQKANAQQATLASLHTHDRVRWPTQGDTTPLRDARCASCLTHPRDSRRHRRGTLRGQP